MSKFTTAKTQTTATQIRDVCLSLSCRRNTTRRIASGKVAITATHESTRAHRNSLNSSRQVSTEIKRTQNCTALQK